jgi:Flp pilus assembly protein TadD
MALGEIAVAVRLKGSPAKASYLRGRILAEQGDAEGARRELYKAVGFASQLGDRDTAEKASDLLASLGTQG